MRGLELRSSVDNLLKRSSSVDETTPIKLAQNKTTDHGTILMDRTLSADDIRQHSAGKVSSNNVKPPKPEEKPQEGMSLLRKLCFVLSFNGGILYVVAFGWLIPCRLSPCLSTEDKWTTNLTNLEITSNLETDVLLDPRFLIFGHADDRGGSIKAFKIADGTEAWNNTLLDNPIKVRCNLKKNENSCFITGTNYIAAFLSENGSIIWSNPGESIREMFLTHDRSNLTYLVGISEDDIHVYDTADGSEVATSSLPCSWSKDVKVAGPWLSKNGYIWTIVCQTNRAIEAYTFRERELLSFQRNDSEPENLDVNFKPLLSKQSSRGSIDLACDVMTTSDSLALSWADMVTMVTAQAPFHHFQKTWERRFSSPLGYNAAVTSITTGHFVGTKSTQIAVSVREGSNSTIYILAENNGTSLAELEFGPKILVSLKKLAGANGEKDALLLESIENASSSNATSPESRTFHMLEYEEDKSVLHFITTAEGYVGSSLSQISSGKSNLLLASSDGNRNIILDRFIIENKDPDKTWCKDEKNANTSFVMYLE